MYSIYSPLTPFIFSILQPKKPKAAFFFFASHMRKKIQNENPDLTFGQITTVSSGMVQQHHQSTTIGFFFHTLLLFHLQMVSDKFKELSPEERAVWEEKAKADRKRYEEEMAEYSAPEDESDEDEPSKKKAKKDKKAPKNARSAYTYFGNEMRETMKAENSDMSFAEVNKMLGERWKQLSAAEKQKFEDMAAADKKRYEKDMESYTPPSGTKKKTKAKKDKNAPKRGSTSFLIFSNEMRPKLKAQNPDMSFSEMGKKLVSSRMVEGSSGKESKVCIACLTFIFVCRESFSAVSLTKKRRHTKRRLRKTRSDMKRKWPITKPQNLRKPMLKMESTRTWMTRMMTTTMTTEMRIERIKTFRYVRNCNLLI